MWHHCSSAGLTTAPKKSHVEKKPAAQVDMFDVGLGAALLMQFRLSNGNVVRILADGRLNSAIEKKRLPDALTDFSMSSKRIDLMVGTHYDRDHLDGLVPIVKEQCIEIGEAWLPPVADDSVPRAADDASKDADMLAIKFGGSGGDAACQEYLTAKAEACSMFAELCVMAAEDVAPDDAQDDRQQKPEFPDLGQECWLDKARAFFEEHEKQACKTLGTDGYSHANDDAQISMSVRKISRVNGGCLGHHCDHASWTCVDFFVARAPPYR
jgi:hypothetical protein